MLTVEIVPDVMLLTRLGANLMAEGDPIMKVIMAESSTVNGVIDLVASLTKLAILQVFVAELAMMFQEPLVARVQHPASFAPRAHVPELRLVPFLVQQRA